MAERKVWAVVQLTVPEHMTDLDLARDLDSSIEFGRARISITSDQPTMNGCYRNPWGKRVHDKVVCTCSEQVVTTNGLL
jgi:hypothetical protein